MSTPYGYIRLTESINIGTGHEKRTGEIIPCQTRKTYMDLLKYGEPHQPEIQQTQATQLKTAEEQELDHFLTDAEKRFDSKKFGLHFDKETQYYGVNLGRTEIDIEDEKGKLHKKIVPLNYVLTGDRRVYRVQGDKCSSIGVNFKNITSLDGIYCISPGVLKNFCEGRLNIIQGDSKNLTSLTSMTSYLQTLTKSQKKSEIGGQDGQGGQEQNPKHAHIYIYNNQDIHTHTPDFFLTSSICVQIGGHDSQGGQGNSMDNVQNDVFEYPIFEDSYFSSEAKHLIEKTNPNRGVYVPLKTLIYSVRCKLKHYIGLPDEGDYDLLALYVVGTYIYPLFPAFPYLQVNAIKESGKSRLLATMGKMCFASLYTASQKPSPLFRYIDGNGGTIIFDEAEGISLDPEKIQIINAGYTKAGGGVLLTDRNNHKVQELFDTYSPKIFGSINNLPDTVITRSIRIAIEKSNLDIYDERIPEFDGDFSYIRDLLYVFGLGHGLSIQRVYQDECLKPEGVRHRYWELYKPLAAIAFYAGEDYFRGVISYIQDKVRNEKKRRLFEDEDAIAISALVRLIKTDDFFSIAQITKAIREEIGAQDIIKKDMNQVEYIAHYDESYKHINGRWVTNFLRNVNLPRRRTDEKDDGRHGGARGRYFKVCDIVDQAIRMNVVENILGVNVLITTGEHVWTEEVIKPESGQSTIEEAEVREVSAVAPTMSEGLNRKRDTLRAVAFCFGLGKVDRQDINFTAMNVYGGDYEFLESSYAILRNDGCIQDRGDGFIVLKPLDEFKKYSGD